MSRSQKVLVAGSGISGISSAKLLLEMGGEVVLYDGNASLDPETLKKEFEEGAKVTIVLGELTRADLSGVEMCIISPGISLETPFVGRDSAGVSVRQGQTGRHHGDQREDYHHSPYRGDHEIQIRGCICGGQYRDSLYPGCPSDRRQQRNGGGGQ